MPLAPDPGSDAHRMLRSRRRRCEVAASSAAAARMVLPKGQRTIRAAAAEEVATSQPQLLAPSTAHASEPGSGASGIGYNRQTRVLAG
jgi:hypothetical protein